MAALTIDQASAHLEEICSRWRVAASHVRRQGEEYKTSANETDDADLRRVQYEESSRMFGYAREIDRDVEALNLVLLQLKAVR